MPRHALRSFFTRVLPIALPLATGCCPDSGTVQQTVSFYQYEVDVDGGLDDMRCAELCETWGNRIENITYCAPVDLGYSLPDGNVFVDYYCRGKKVCVGGRRPEGFIENAFQRFARMAELEAASVHAFHILAEELSGLGAPAALVHAALRSARDEVRHAQMMGRLAGVTPRVAPPPRRVRSLVEVAVENAREGCVRETFGAAVARLESVTARSSRVRKVMAGIFPDEERHAELAFAVDGWARPSLTRVERGLVDDAKRAALDELRAEVIGSRALLALVDGMPVAA